jgi:short-subunit dehydrogenase
MAAFQNRVVIVTGASEGIGRALALELAREHPRLVLTARSAERLASLERDCWARGAADVLCVADDLTRPDACESLVSATVARFGRVDAVVNNAGATMWSRFDALADLAIFERLMQINFHAPVRLTHAALPHLRKSRGLVVAVASLAGLTGVPERSAYAASKHALVGFCDSLRIELKGSGVDVTVIAPDFVVSEIHRRAIGPDGAQLGTTPMQEGEIMTAEQCAKLIRHAMARRKRLLITSSRGRLGRWLKLVNPEAIDRIAARAIRDRR